SSPTSTAGSSSSTTSSSGVRASDRVKAFRRLAFAGALTAGLATSASAHAAGLYFADRGVRPAARGGAFIAGADDLGAIAYNPAGIYDAGSQFLLDASIVNFNADYTRTAQLRQVDPNNG